MNHLLMETGTFNKSDDEDLITGATVKVTEVGRSQLGLAIGPEVTHKVIPSDCVPLEVLLSSNGDELDNGFLNSTGLLS